MLSDLVAELPVHALVVPPAAAGLRIEVGGVSHDSRRVAAGDLFVAWGGERFDGRRFAADALERGAVAVLAQGPPLEEPGVGPAPWLEADDPRALLGELASRLLDRPDHELVTIGITGTNGKSTIVRIVASLLEAAGRPTGMMGTLGASFRDLELYGERTTPEGSDLFHNLRAMRDAGAEAVAFEVSSHALDQGRVAAARFDAAVFTNLTRDHLDYHHTLESYYEAKRRLFDLLKPGGAAVVNLDDAWGVRLADELRERRVPLVTFGEGGDVELLSARLSTRGSVGRVRTPRGELVYETALLGRYNVWNTLAALAVAEHLELPAEAVREGMASVPTVRGRLDRVDRGQAFDVFVDFAHTDGALEAALQSLREIAGGRIAVVFGCGGEKDRGKRPLMGDAAGRLADLAVLTDDNPRGEASSEIHREVLVGLEAADHAEVVVEPDRARAIRLALERAAAEPGWTVLIAGKGHERTQIVGDRVRPFVDHDVAGRVLDELVAGPRSAADRGSSSMPENDASQAGGTGGHHGGS